MHEYLPVAITLIAIFAGVLMNKSDMNERFANLSSRLDRFEADVNARFDRIESKQDRMQADLSEFHRVMGQHDKAIEILEKRK